MAGSLQGFPIEQDEHLLTVLRSIERNPLRAGLVAWTEDWLWSSLREQGGDLAWIHPSQVRGPKDECADDGRRGEGPAVQCESGNAVWERAVGAADVEAIGAGGQPYSAWPATEPSRKVERPLFTPHSLFTPFPFHCLFKFTNAPDSEPRPP